MATGFLSSGQCSETLFDAQNVYFSGLLPFSYYDSNLKKAVTVEYVSAVPPATGWLKKTTTGTAFVTVPAVAPSFPSCQSPSEFFTQGLELGGAIVAVMFVGWGVAAAADLLRGR